MEDTKTLTQAVTNIGGITWNKLSEGAPTRLNTYLVALKRETIEANPSPEDPDGNPIRTDIYTMLYDPRSETWNMMLIDAPFDPEQIGWWAETVDNPEFINNL